MKTTRTPLPRQDRLRQVLNLTLAVTQLGATYLAFASGLGRDIAELSNATNTPVTPATYAFGIWSFIYPASIAYATYAALPAQRENELLRRLGPYTASAFLANTVWAVVFQLGLFWPSVIVIVWMLTSLALAFTELSRTTRPFTSAEKWLVRLPLSVFTGWITVATIANSTFALRSSGVRDLGLGETPWAVLMLAAATFIGAAMTRFGRRNVWYAGTVVWALIGIVVANVAREPNTTVAITASVAAGLVALSALPATDPARSSSTAK